MSNESTSHPKARTAIERGLVAPEQISKNIRPSGTAKMRRGDCSLQCKFHVFFPFRIHQSKVNLKLLKHPLALHVKLLLLSPTHHLPIHQRLCHLKLPLKNPHCHSVEHQNPRVSVTCFGVVTHHDPNHMPFR